MGTTYNINQSPLRKGTEKLDEQKRQLKKSCVTFNW